MINTIDDYINSYDGIIFDALTKVKKVIKSKAPVATEKISWKMPTFYYKGNLIHFAAQKKHLGIYPGLIERLPFQERISKYKFSKGAIQFPYENIDYQLIEDIVSFLIEKRLNE